MGYATSLKDRPNKQEMEKAARGTPTPPAIPHADKPITNQQKGQLFALATDIAEQKQWAKDWVKDTLYQYFSVDSTTKLTTAQGAHAIRALYQTRDKGLSFDDALAQTKGT
jgi:hypothetical protein